MVKWVELQSVKWGERIAPTPIAMFGRLVPAFINSAIASMNGVTLRIATSSGSLALVGKAVAAVAVVTVEVTGVLVVKMSSADAAPCWVLQKREASIAKHITPTMLATLLAPHIEFYQRMR